MADTALPTRPAGGKNIVFTGGSGKAGRHVLPYLVEKGHKILNLDLVPFPDPAADIYTLKTDLTQSGQVFNALTSHYNMAGFGNKSLPQPPDVVIHFAAYARNLLVPDNETFHGNVTSTYNVIEAACKLGVKKIIIASSETTYGVCFAQGESDYHCFPLEEDYDVDPEDSYALSKICGEKTARAFARRFGVDIYVLRVGNVIEPHEYALNFPKYIANPPSRKRNAWSYIDARDLGQICDLAIKKSGLGFQIFNATNDTITVKGTTKEFLQKECPNVKITREMGEYEAPLSNRKIREVLGFKDVHDWRNGEQLLVITRHDLPLVDLLDQRRQQHTSTDLNRLDRLSISPRYVVRLNRRLSQRHINRSQKARRPAPSARNRLQLFQALRTAERPTHLVFADGRQEAIPDVTPWLQPSVVGDIAAYTFFAFGGMFLGGECGLLSGATAGRRTIMRDPETRSRIEKAYLNYRIDVLKKQTEVLQNSRAGLDGVEPILW
ncbi:hypothetical protein B7463_g4890, partial [Scytalidium lignicola]